MVFGGVAVQGSGSGGGDCVDFGGVGGEDEKRKRREIGRTRKVQISGSGNC